LSSLGAIVADAQIVIACGPGGIGKTTCAAAIGDAVARTSDRRVLVVTVDPARRLADALGVGGIGNEPTAVPIAGPGELDVAMLDTKASWDALIRRFAPDAVTAQRILSNALYDNLTSRFVQSHDYIAMERLHEFVVDGSYDLIVVDTPPTRNALDFLDAPGRMAEFFSSRLLRWLLAPTRGGVVSFAARPFASIADRILGGSFVGDITEFFLLLNTMHDGFVARAHEVESLLTRSTTTFLVVSTLESVPVGEARFFVEELARRRLAVRGWVLNRTLPSSIGDGALEPAVAALAAADLAPAAAALGVPEDSLARVRTVLTENLVGWRRLAEQEAELSRRLSDVPAPRFAVPSLDGEIGDLGGLRRLGDLLLAAEPSGLPTRGIA
jgi:anion-transporting  ArsA/GET3 family ATPase